MRLEVDVVVAEFADFSLDRFQLAGDLVVLADFVFQQLGAFGQVLLQFLFAVTNRFQIRTEALGMFFQRLELGLEVVELAGEIRHLGIGFHELGALQPVFLVDLLVVVANGDDVVTGGFQRRAGLGCTLAQGMDFGLGIFQLGGERPDLVFGVKQVGGDLGVFGFQPDLGFHGRPGAFKVFGHQADRRLAFRSKRSHLFEGLVQTADAGLEPVQMVHLFLHFQGERGKMLDIALFRSLRGFLNFACLFHGLDPLLLVTAGARGFRENAHSCLLTFPPAPPGERYAKL